ncbi:MULTISPECIES: hypothetical protein [unclassified Arthrobacter]|uniref:hypothetical protein n=1 Tax=unclassified Arthrobacter TaxID=235627 RepID=UPI001F18C3FA|nr:hypothetical protein [Arthrobacter sp. FW305-BF8]UKA55530.1 hypothetical protein LFT45_06315 [Arthrobacter sp. FW305-BF8]
MKSLREVIRSEFFPSAAALTLVVLFWLVGLLGGLSLLSRSRPPLDTLSWLLFVYASVVLSSAVGLWAAIDLLRRLSRRRHGLSRRRQEQSRRRKGRDSGSGDE